MFIVRDPNPGDEMSTGTVCGDKHIPAGKTVTGVTVAAWLKWNSTVAKCTGVTTIETRFLDGGFLEWTLPPDVVAKVNAAVGWQAIGPIRRLSALRITGIYVEPDIRPNRAGRSAIR